MRTKEQTQTYETMIGKPVKAKRPHSESVVVGRIIQLQPDDSEYAVTHPYIVAQPRSDLDFNVYGSASVTEMTEFDYLKQVLGEHITYSASPQVVLAMYGMALAIKVPFGQASKDEQQSRENLSKEYLYTYVSFEDFALTLIRNKIQRFNSTSRLELLRAIEVLQKAVKGEEEDGQ